MADNPYEDESWVPPSDSYHRDSEPCNQDCQPDEEHSATCKFWFTNISGCSHLGCGVTCRYEGGDNAERSERSEDVPF